MRVACLLFLVATGACATTRAPQADPETVACKGGDAAACASRGLRAFAGEGVPRDEPAAAAWLMAACERGHGQSCANLGVLYATGRGVRKDEGRACDLGLADACARAGRPAPPVGQVPGLVLPPPPPPEPPPPRRRQEIENALQYADLYVPVRDHEALGLTRSALELDPPAPGEDVELIQPLLDARGARVASCLPPPYRLQRMASAKASAVMSFVLTGDGRTAGVVVRVHGPQGASPPPVECVRAAVIQWEFPRPRLGGRMWFEVTGNAPEEAEEMPRAAGASLPGFRPPREKVRGCIASSIRVPPGVATARIAARFLVDSDGRARDFVLVTKAEDEGAAAFARAVREAVYSCAFVPGTDGNGQPIGLWIVQPFAVHR